ncbi:hypothetical protein [Desulfosarcina ovata]|uniref:hypothetical protein n=1 Tax=Desulfosarcina ovata TaxID=83564 RepID=UPI0012D35C58|nr:hypothetical protein [Desulfosarcina ovata]
MRLKKTAVKGENEFLNRRLSVFFMGNLYFYGCPQLPPTRLRLRNQLIKPIDKILLIGRIPENVFSFDPPDDHVMQNPGSV